MDRARFAPFVAIALMAPVLHVSPAVASAPAHPMSDRPLSAAQPAGEAASDTRELDRTTFTLDGHPLPEPRYRPRPESRAPKATPKIGTVRPWLGLDDTTGKYYEKSYTLKAVGKHIEVWVAQDLAFPATDCRKDAVDITDSEVQDLIKEFDGTIYPKETAAFSTPPDRDGSNAALQGDFTGDGDKTVTLVDNIRDDNYYHFPKSITYVAGFFSAQLNELFDRNVMTIDAYDWKHRLGADPANDPTDDLCSSRPEHPRMYEGTFAHEWQHLLEYYADPDEALWVNEGLSDFAQTLTGYVNSRATVNDRGVDNHLLCFQGFAPVKTKANPNPRDCGGPENSLNLWNEGAPSDVLADYGNVYQFMLYLRDRFGIDTISRLHRDRARHGLSGVEAALPPGNKLYDVLHDYQTMTLVDRIVDRPGGRVIGVPKVHVIASSLRSTVNLDNKTAYATPGAAPNGADYVRLPTPLRSISFQGATTLPSLPTGWTVVDKTLFSGNVSDLNNSAVLPVTVPAKDATLKLETAWDLEEAYDFGYVEVSTDDGKTYTPLAGDHTTTGPLGPGLTAASNGTVVASYDLAAYAGKKVLLALHYVSDNTGNKGGWRIGQITLGGSVLDDGTSLDGWRSPTDLVPTPVHAWHVRLVGIKDRTADIVPLDRFAELRGYPEVVAIVSYDEPTEKLSQYAPYVLMANGAVQPGGEPLP